MSRAWSFPKTHHSRQIKRISHQLAKLAIGAVAFALLSWLIWALLPEPEPVPLQIGEWTAVNSSDWMRVSSSSIRIGRDDSAYAVLPNNANGRRVYDKNDLAKVHPQRIRILENGNVEWIREAAGPSPEYRLVFRKRGE